MLLYFAKGGIYTGACVVCVAARVMSQGYVHICVDTPLLSSAACGPLGAPPYTQINLILELSPYLTPTSWIWSASSRVGASMSAMGPSPGCTHDPHISQ